MSSQRFETSKTVLKLSFVPFALASILGASPAHAVCTPQVANGVTATCTGVTLNQGPQANIGYGTTNSDDVTVNVLSGATVTGTSLGIGLGSFAVINNAGTIIGNGSGSVFANIITSLNNSGTISAPDPNSIALSASSAILNITNSGTIVGSVGINAGVEITNLYNSGVIRGTNGGGISYGGDLFNLVNTGTIRGDNGDGISVNRLHKVTNAGTIIGASGRAIHDTSANIDTLLILLAGSNIQGAIDLGGGVNTLNVGNGLSIANTFVGGAPVIGTTNGAPFAVSGNQVAVVDTTGLAMADEAIVDLTNGIFNSVFNALNTGGTGGPAGPTSPFAPPSYVTGPAAASGAPLPQQGARAWANVFGSTRHQEGDSPTVDARNWVGGLISGADGRIGANSRAGAFLGGSTGEVDVSFDSQDIDVDSFYGGLYAGTQSGPFAMGLAVTGGWTWNDSERHVANNLAAGGIETAKADYDGYFVSPELAVAVKSAFGLVPSARVRYAGYFLDGFTETGASDNLTVGDRNLHIVQGRLQLAMPIVTSGADSTYTRIEPYIGLEGRMLLSGDNVDAVLLGQNLSFDPGGEDEIGGVFLGLNGSARIAANTDLFGNVEAAFETEGSDRIGGNLGLRMRF